MTACMTVGCSQGAGPHERHDDLMLSGGWGWHGAVWTIPPTTTEAALADLREQIRAAYLDAVRSRDRAAQDPTSTGRIKAVAHQAHASRLLRILDTQRDRP